MKPLACWLGRHEWMSHVEPGVTYKACARCGKEPRQRRGIPAQEQQSSAYAGGGGGGGDPGMGGGGDGG